MADTDQLYKRADDAFQKHSWDYARDLFLQILALDPNNAKARKALHITIVRKFQAGGAPGWFKLKALSGKTWGLLKPTKDHKKRVDICQKHLNDDPNNANFRAHLADSLLALGHHDGAAAEGEMALEADGQNVSAAKTLVASLIHLNRSTEAEKLLNRLGGQMKADRELDRLRVQLAASQTIAKGFEDATGKEGFRKVMKDTGKAEDLEKAQHLIRTDDEIATAIEQLENEAAEDPTNSRICKKLGDLIFEKKKDFSTAQDWYKKASQLSPQDSVLRDRVDDCTLRIHDVGIEKAAKAKDPKLGELKVARLKFRIQSFERRVHDRPTDMGLRLELGKAYYDAGPALLDKAIGQFQQSVKDPKRKSNSHQYLGMAFQKKKMYDMADKQFEQSEAGVLSQELKLQIVYRRSLCAAEAGNLPKAAELGQRIMEVDISYKDISQLVEKWAAG